MRLQNGRWRTSDTLYHLDRYIEEGNIQNETHLGAKYSIICVNKTLGELNFGRSESTFLETMRF